MARTAFGDAFSRSFESTVASIRRQQESERAEERLLGRMKAERQAAVGENLLKDLTTLGVPTESFIDKDGNVNRGAAEKQIIDARNQKAAGAASLYSEFVPAPPDEGLSRDVFFRSLDAAKAAEAQENATHARMQARLVAAEEAQVERQKGRTGAEIERDVASRLPTADVGAMPANFLELAPAQQQSTLNRLEALNKARRDFDADAETYGVKPETTDWLSPVTASKQAELAKAKQQYPRDEADKTLNRAADFTDKRAAQEAKAQLENFTPAEKSYFQSTRDIYTPELDFVNDPRGATRAVNLVLDASKRKYELLDTVAKKDIDFYNTYAKFIPVDGMKVRTEDSGALNREDMAELKRRIQFKKDNVSGQEGVEYFHGPLTPPPLDGDAGAAAPGAAPGVPAANPFRAGGLSGRSETSTEGTGEAAGDGATPFPAPISGPIPMPGTFPPLESDSKEREFWEGLGASRQTYEAARNAYNFDVGAGPFGREGRYSLPGPRPGSRGRVILPLIRGMGDINPKEESLFDAAMSRLSAQDAFLTKRIDPIDRRIQEIKGTGASPTYSKGLVLRQELARLLKDREPLSEKLSKVEELRNDLVWSFR